MAPSHHPPLVCIACGDRTRRAASFAGEDWLSALAAVNRMAEWLAAGAFVCSEGCEARVLATLAAQHEGTRREVRA